MKVDSNTPDEELRARLLTCDGRGEKVKAACLDELLRRQRPTAAALTAMLDAVIQETAAVSVLDGSGQHLLRCLIVEKFTPILKPRA